MTPPATDADVKPDGQASHKTTDRKPARKPGDRRPLLASASAFRRYKRQLVLAAFGALLSAGGFGAGLSMLVFIFNLVFQKGQNAHDVIREYMVGEDHSIITQTFGQLLLNIIPQDAFWAFIAILGVILLMATISNIGRYIHNYTVMTVVLRVTQIWRERLFDRLLRAPMLDLMRVGVSDPASRIIADTRVMNAGYLALMGQSTESILKGGAALVVAFSLNWRLCLVALVTVPIVAVCLRKFAKVIKKTTRKALRKRGALNRVINESLGGIRDAKGNEAEGFERRRFRVINKMLFTQQAASRRTKAISTPVVETLGLITVMAVGTVAAWMVMRNQASLTNLFMVLGSLGAAAASLRPLTHLNNILSESDAAANRVMAIMRMPVEERGRDRTNVPKLPTHHRDVVFENISFRYPDQDADALSQINLHAAHGQSVAIVGSNGSGKTTLLSMLPRLLDPDIGRVLIDGKDIREHSLASLRQQLAIVTQQSFLFKDTIRANITYGRRHASEAEMLAASQAAYADEFIRDMPGGYDRVLGEAGSGLSGGQRQRICIARAILRNPTILILDEATSQVDAESEAKIAAALEKIREGRSTFIIAHRLSTVIHSDQIVVMDAGRIIDTGKHDDLLERCDIYRTLTRTQLSSKNDG